MEPDSREQPQPQEQPSEQASSPASEQHDGSSESEGDNSSQSQDEAPAEQPEQLNSAEVNKLQEQQQHKKTFIKKLKSEVPNQDGSIDQQMQHLLKQAEYYANYLLSHHESARNKQRQQRNRKRGRYQVEEAEERLILEQEQQEQGTTYTHLSEQPSILSGGQLKFYQMVGLNWLVSLYEGGINGILADDMGLGKTIQTISIIAFLRQFKKINGPHLIVAPKITLGNWVKELKKWLPVCRVVKLIATKEERQPIIRDYILKGNFDIVVTSFEGVRICLKYLRKIRWKYLIIDEAHKIKNEESMLSQVVRSLSTNFKLLLTGTPLQNNLHELWSLLNFILPGVFDSSEVFDRWFSSNNDKSAQVSKQELQKKNIHMIQQLHKILRPFMLRRTKKEVERNLPEKKEIHIYVGLTDTQVKLYKSLLQNRNLVEDQKKVYLNLLMQLRKVCNHPYLFPNVEEEGSPALGEHLISASGKLTVLDQLLRKLAGQSHQILIFSQMTMVLDILEDYCNFRGFRYCRIDGSTDMDSRDRQINDFMEQGSDRFIFLLSTRAGGLGINLTAADTVIIYDSDWNPQMDLQAMDRAHRIGQKNKVNVYRLITENTVEEKIIERQTIKLKWDSLVIQQGRMSNQKNRTLSRDEMKDMLQFGASAIFKADGGTMSQEKIEQVLQRGETKTNELNQTVENRVKEQAAAFDLGMSSINIFDCFIDHNKDDEQALDEALARDLQGEHLRARRDKKDFGKNIIIGKDGKPRPYKKVQLPQHHFYEEKDHLTDLLQKEQDGGTLTELENENRVRLLKTGYSGWSRQDFQTFIHGSEKFGKDNFREISKLIGKPETEIENYSKVFWERLDELGDKQRIRKHIEQGQERISNRRHHNELLEWKRQQGIQVDFNPSVYTKFRSKLFTLEADRFLVQNLLEVGSGNMSVVRDLIRSESMFRYDHFFRSRTESELSKRMLSLYKLIEKERDISINGVDTTMLKDRQNKKQKKMQKLKLKQAELVDRLKLNKNGGDHKQKTLSGLLVRKSDQAVNREVISIHDDENEPLEE